MTNLNIIKSFSSELWDKKDLSSIDRYFFNDVKIYSPLDITYGTEKLKRVMQQWQHAFPDLVVQWDDFICNETKVVSQWRAKGTHQGIFYNHSPTHRKIHYSGTTIYAIASGKINEYWAYVNMSSIIEQITSP